MLNTQYSPDIKHNNFNNQIMDHETIYLTWVSQGKTPEEIKKLCERLIELHNKNSESKFQIKIGGSATIGELYTRRE